MTISSLLGVPYQTFDADNDAHARHHDQKSENAADEVAQPDDDFRRQRQVHAQAREQRRENRHDLPEQQCDDAAAIGHDTDRVDQGGLHGALQLDVLFNVGRQALQNGVENTAGLARFHHVDVQARRTPLGTGASPPIASRRLPPPRA